MIIFSKRSRFLWGLYGLHGTKSVISAFLVNDHSCWGFLGYPAKLLFSQASDFLWTILKWSFLYIQFLTSFCVYLFLNKAKIKKLKNIGLIQLKNSLKIKIDYLLFFLLVSLSSTSTLFHQVSITLSFIFSCPMNLHWNTKMWNGLTVTCYEKSVNPEVSHQKSSHQRFWRERTNQLIILDKVELD